MPIFHLLTGLLWLYVLLRFLVPLALNPWLLGLIGFVLLLGSQHHFLTRWFFGRSFSPEVPRPLGMLANALFGTLILLFAFQLALDLLFLAGSLLKGGLLTPPHAVRYLIGVAAVGLAVLGVSQAVKVPEVKEVELAIPGLPEEFEGYRMIHLTDLHLSQLFAAPWAKAVVERANAQNVDLIVSTGDLLDGTMEARNHDVAPLGELKARDGIYIAPGNHEYYYGYELWMTRYQELGMTPLANTHVRITRGDSHLVIAGVTDIASARFGLPTPDYEGALQGAPANAPIIMLAHQPKVASQSALAGADVQLSGHTHGGMIKGFDRLVARFNKGYVSGFYNVDGMQLYVNNGTALWNGFALRIGVPSELTVITLRRAA